MMNIRKQAGYLGVGGKRVIGGLGSNTALDALIRSLAPGGVGIGVAPYSGTLPAGFSEMAGTRVLGHDNWGNYQYSDG